MGSTASAPLKTKHSKNNPCSSCNSVFEWTPQWLIVAFGTLLWPGTCSWRVCGSIGWTAANGRCLPKHWQPQSLGSKADAWTYAMEGSRDTLTVLQIQHRTCWTPTPSALVPGGWVGYPRVLKRASTSENLHLYWRSPRAAMLRSHGWKS